MLSWCDKTFKIVSAIFQKGEGVASGYLAGYWFRGEVVQCHGVTLNFKILSGLDLGNPEQ